MSIRVFLKNKDYQQHRIFSIIVLITIVAGIWIISSENNQKKAFRKSQYTWAVIDKINIQAKMGRSIDLHYFNNHNHLVELENIESSVKSLEKRQEKDTILIRYSLTDNKVVEVAYYFWNEIIKDSIIEAFKNE